MIYLLIIHIALGATLLTIFAVRYIAVMTAKINKKTGSKFGPILGSGIVVSGTALAIIDKSPISSICLSSIVIISLIIIAEYVLQRLPATNK